MVGIRAVSPSGVVIANTSAGGLSTLYVASYASTPFKLLNVSLLVDGAGSVGMLTLQPGQEAHAIGQVYRLPSMPGLMCNRRYLALSSVGFALLLFLLVFIGQICVPGELIGLASANLKSSFSLPRGLTLLAGSVA
jgi:hypothetical protein